MKKKTNPLTSPFKSGMEWYKKQSELTQIIVLWSLIIIGAVFAFWLLKTPLGEGATGIPKLQIPKLNTTIYIPKLNMTLVLIKKVPKEQYPITLESILCTYIYDYNQTNMTWGRTTCGSVAYFNITNTEYDCICYTAI